MEERRWIIEGKDRRISTRKDTTRQFRINANMSSFSLPFSAALLISCFRSFPLVFSNGSNTYIESKYCQIKSMKMHENGVRCVECVRVSCASISLGLCLAGIYRVRYTQSSATKNNESKYGQWKTHESWTKEWKNKKNLEPLCAALCSFLLFAIESVRWALELQRPLPKRIECTSTNIYPIWIEMLVYTSVFGLLKKGGKTGVCFSRSLAETARHVHSRFIRQIRLSSPPAITRTLSIDFVRRHTLYSKNKKTSFLSSPNRGWNEIFITSCEPKKLRQKRLIESPSHASASFHCLPAKCVKRMDYDVKFTSSSKVYEKLTKMFRLKIYFLIPWNKKKITLY